MRNRTAKIEFPYHFLKSLKENNNGKSNWRWQAPFRSVGLLIFQKALPLFNGLRSKFVLTNGNYKHMKQDPRDAEVTRSWMTSMPTSNNRVLFHTESIPWKFGWVEYYCSIQLNRTPWICKLDSEPYTRPERPRRIQRETIESQNYVLGVRHSISFTKNSIVNFHSVKSLTWLLLNWTETLSRFHIIFGLPCPVAASGTHRHA